MYPRRGGRVPRRSQPMSNARSLGRIGQPDPPLSEFGVARRRLRKARARHQRPRRADEHRAPRRAARPLAPGRARAPGGQARLLRITGPGRQVGIFSHRQLQRWAAGYREPRGVGPSRAPVTPAGMEGRPADGHRAAWSDARPVPWAAANAPHLGVRLCSCGEAAKAAWALDPLQDCPRPPGCGCLPVTSTPCPEGLGCITGTRPSCSRQRPGECAAAGGLCAAEAQLRDPCS
jgi:hypothetical protein